MNSSFVDMKFRFLRQILVIITIGSSSRMGICGDDSIITVEFKSQYNEKP